MREKKVALSGLQDTPIEPGLLRLFRIFLITQLLVIFIGVLAHGVHAGRTYNWSILGFSTGGILLLLVYLHLPILHKFLKKIYLPLALVASVTFSLMQQDAICSTQLLVSGDSSEEFAWQLFLFLFVPLLLTTWQYGFKTACGFWLFIALLDHGLMHLCNPSSEEVYFGVHARLVFIRSAAFLFVMYIFSHIVKQMRLQQTALQNANQKLAHYALTLEQLTLSRERNRLACELHDTLAHTLSGLAVQLEGVKSIWENDPQQARALLEASLAATRSGLSETRNAIQALRSNSLEDMGLELALQDLGRSAAERAGFGFHFEKMHALSEFSENTEQCLYRVAQEALENIVNHAQASKVLMRLETLNELVVLTIEDNGMGFDMDGETAAGHFGLRGMAERAELAGGRLQMESAPGRGTRVRLEVKNA